MTRTILPGECLVLNVKNETGNKSEEEEEEEDIEIDVVGLSDNFHSYNR